VVSIGLLTWTAGVLTWTSDTGLLTGVANGRSDGSLAACLDPAVYGRPAESGKGARVR